jgi:phosphocarrier protein HPr
VICGEIQIKGKFGLHLRPATLFASIAKQFCSEITLEYNGKIVEGKSAIGLLQLGAQEGSRILVRIDGEDEQEAMKVILAFVTNGFD